MNDQQICKTLLGYAQTEAGVNAKVKVTLNKSEKKAVSVLAGNPQSYDNSQTRSIQLTVIIGQQKASAASEDLSDTALRTLAKETVAMAKVTPANKDAIIANKGEYITDAEMRSKALDLFDNTPMPNAATLQTMAKTMEAAALAVDGATGCESAEVTAFSTSISILTSEGFDISLSETFYDAGLGAIAGTDNSQTTKYGDTAKRYVADLEDLAKLGRETAEKAVAKQGAESIKSGKMTILFDREVTPTLLRMFSSAINGMAVDKGMTFLKDSMGKKVFADNITIVDDPTIPRGLGSTPCDSQGVASEPMTLVADGTLKTWILGLAAAKRLSLTSNGRADGTTNMYMRAGTISRDELIASVDDGILITDMIGHSVNITTGDFSRGAEGFIIKNGKITKPVSEITIAGNLKDMFLNMVPADDLKIEYSTNAPTVKIDGMTVAGK